MSKPASDEIIKLVYKFGIEMFNLGYCAGKSIKEDGINAVDKVLDLKEELPSIIKAYGGE